MSRNLGKTQHTSIDVEDVSGDELSITSVKGEGCGSDLSDSEAKQSTGGHITQRGGRSGKKALSFSTADQNLKRPNTPMDFRGPPGNQQLTQTGKNSNRPVESALKSVRFQQFGNDPQTGDF